MFISVFSKPKPSLNNARRAVADVRPTTTETLVGMGFRAESLMGAGDLSFVREAECPLLTVEVLDTINDTKDLMNYLECVLKYPGVKAGPAGVNTGPDVIIYVQALKNLSESFKYALYHKIEELLKVPTKCSTECVLVLHTVDSMGYTFVEDPMSADNSPEAFVAYTERLFEGEESPKGIPVTLFFWTFVNIMFALASGVNHIFSASDDVKVKIARICMEYQNRLKHFMTTTGKRSLEVSYVDAGVLPQMAMGMLPNLATIFHRSLTSAVKVEATYKASMKYLNFDMLISRMLAQESDSFSDKMRGLVRHMENIHLTTKVLTETADMNTLKIRDLQEMIHDSAQKAYMVENGIEIVVEPVRQPVDYDEDKLFPLSEGEEQRFIDQQLVDAGAAWAPSTPPPPVAEADMPPSPAALPPPSALHSPLPPLPSAAPRGRKSRGEAKTSRPPSSASSRSRSSSRARGGLADVPMEEWAPDEPGFVRASNARGGPGWNPSDLTGIYDPVHIAGMYDGFAPDVEP